MTRFALCLLAVSMGPLLMGTSSIETAGLKVSIEDGRLVLSEFDLASLHKTQKETGKKRFFLRTLWVAKVLKRGKDEPRFTLWRIDVPYDSKTIPEPAPVWVPDRLVVGEIPSGATESVPLKSYQLGEIYDVHISGDVSWWAGYTNDTGVPLGLLARFSQNFCVLQDKNGQDYVQLLDPGDECKPKRKWFGWFK